ncbi:MAG: hypothetical protein IJJ26_13510 [Victivallales bacterium]|nr:hypothetical protein [Victivallales bacterium]
MRTENGQGGRRDAVGTFLPPAGRHRYTNMEQHGYFKVNQRSLYATAYLPKGKAVTAAVLCEPFGEEKRCAYRMLVRLARQLCSRGVAVLRFDFSGTGDSSGVHEAASWNDWQEEARAAVAFLKGLAGVSDCTCLGFRAGAILAAGCANLCTKLVLCEPILTGAELFNDLERRQKIKDMMGKAPVAEGTLPPGARDFGGFVLSERLITEMQTAKLDAASIPETCRVLLLHVTGAKTYPRTWEGLVARSDARIIADKPFWGQVDYFESDAVNTPIADFLAPSTEETK